MSIKKRAKPITPEPKETISVNGSRPLPIDLTTDGDDLPSSAAKLSGRSTVAGDMPSDVIDLTSEANCESDDELRIVDPTVPHSSGFAIGSSASTSSNDRAGSLALIKPIRACGGRLVLPPSMTVPSEDDEDVYMYPGNWSDDDLDSVVTQDSRQSVGSLGAAEEINQRTEADELSRDHDDNSSAVVDQHKFDISDEDFYESKPNPKPVELISFTNVSKATASLISIQAQILRTAIGAHLLARKMKKTRKTRKTRKMRKMIMTMERMRMTSWMRCRNFFMTNPAPRRRFLC